MYRNLISQNITDNWQIGSCRRQDCLSNCKRWTFEFVFEAILTSKQLSRINSTIHYFGITAVIRAKQAVNSKRESVTTNTGVFFVLICCLAVRSKTNNTVTGLNVAAVNDVTFLDCGYSCDINSDSCSIAADISCFATCIDKIDSKVTHFLEKDVVSLNNLSKGFVIYTTAIARNVIWYKNIINHTNACHVVCIHNESILSKTIQEFIGDTFSEGKVSYIALGTHSVGVNNLSIVAYDVVRQIPWHWYNLTESTRIQSLVHAFCCLMDTLLGRRDTQVSIRIGSKLFFHFESSSLKISLGFCLQYWTSQYVRIITRSKRFVNLAKNKLT